MLRNKSGLLLLFAVLLGGCSSFTTVSGYIGSARESTSSIAIDPLGGVPDNFCPLKQVQVVATLVDARGMPLARDTYYSQETGQFSLVVGPRNWLDRLLGRKLVYRLVLYRREYEPAEKYVRLPLARDVMLVGLLRQQPPVAPAP